MSARIEHGDCREVMRALTAEGVLVDSIVCDPPYHLASIVKRFGAGSPNDTAAPHYKRLTRGFMGKEWDGDIASQPETWLAALDVLKPGGHLLAFGGTRTHHRVWSAIEDAGFEVRDTVMWVYGSGFPKSHNAGSGWGTALKPAWEPIIVARKPLIGTVAANIQAFGTGALNIDGCRVEGAQADDYGRSAANARRTKNAHDGFEGKSFKISERDGEYASPLGRWPANLVHDGSEEVLAGFPEQSGGGTPKRRISPKTAGIYGKFAHEMEVLQDGIGGSSGNAARFFYCAKASRADRDEGLTGEDKPLLWSAGTQNPGSFQSAGTKKSAKNNHPTVKPTALMQYLCRLVTPPGGLVLDPFMGSGSTGKAAIIEGFRFIGIEKEAEYIEIARARIGAAR